MEGVTANMTTGEIDVSLRVVNKSPLFYGVVVTGGVVIILVLCLIFLCLSLHYRTQRHGDNLFATRIQLVEERATGQELYDDVVSIRRSIPASKAHNIDQNGTSEEIKLHKYEEIRCEAVNREDNSHSEEQLDSGMKNTHYKDLEGNTQPTSRQPAEQYNTLVQVGSRSLCDHDSVSEVSAHTYAMLK